MLDFISIDSLEGREFRYHDSSAVVKFVSEVHNSICINRGGQLIEKSYSEFLDEVQSQDAIFTKRLVKPVNRFALTPEHRAEIERREAYLFELHKFSSPTSHAQAVIDVVRHRLNDTKPMSRATLNRMYKIWKKDGYDAALQVIGSKKSYPNRILAEIEPLIEKSIQKHYLVRNGLCMTHAHKKLVQICERIGYDKTLIPSLRTYQRRINDIPEYEVILARKGKSEADKQFRLVKQKMVVNDALGLVEGDSAHFNIGCHELIDGEKYFIGSVSIDLGFDAATGSLLGYNIHIGDKAEREEYIISMLSHCINKKPDPSYIQYGLPRKFIKDGGTGYRSDLTTMFLDMIGCESGTTPTRKPWCKPFVERFVQTLRRDFFEHTDGYLGKFDPTVYTDLNLKQAARLTVEQFTQKFANFIREYHNTPLKRLNNRTPNQAWIESTKIFPPMIPEDITELNQYKPLKISDRSIDLNKGVHHLSQKFNSDELAILRRKIKANSKSKKILVDILVDPNNASSISVIVPDKYAKKPGELELLEVGNVDVSSYGKSYAQIRAFEKGIRITDGAPCTVNYDNKSKYGKKPKIGTLIDIIKGEELSPSQQLQALEDLLAPTKESVVPRSKNKVCKTPKSKKSIDEHEEVELDD